MVKKHQDRQKNSECWTEIIYNTASHSITFSFRTSQNSFLNALPLYFYGMYPETERALSFQSNRASVLINMA